MPFTIARGADVALVGNSLALTTPLGRQWVVADLRVFARPVSVHLLVASAARVALNARAWVAEATALEQHNAARDSLGRNAAQAVALAADRAQEVSEQAAALLVNLLACRDNVARLVAAGALRALIQASTWADDTLRVLAGDEQQEVAPGFSGTDLAHAFAEARASTIAALLQGALVRLA
jgi:hypothetical protein